MSREPSTPDIEHQIRQMRHAISDATAMLHSERKRYNTLLDTLSSFAEEYFSEVAPLYEQLHLIHRAPISAIDAESTTTKNHDEQTQHKKTDQLISSTEVDHCRQLYRSIVKLCHPDAQRKQTESLDYFKRATEAYQQHDVTELIWLKNQLEENIDHVHHNQNHQDTLNSLHKEYEGLFHILEELTDRYQQLRLSDLHTLWQQVRLEKLSGNNPIATIKHHIQQEIAKKAHEHA